MDKIPDGFIGSYIRVNDTDPRMTIYKSMYNLWTNRDKHQLFIVNKHLAEASIGLAALSRYCRIQGKKLLIDIHECISECKKDPEIESDNIHDLITKKCPGKAYCLTHNSEPNSIEDCCVILEGYMYHSLVSMAQLNLGGLYHEIIPIHWSTQTRRLESVYGDIWYKSA